MEETQVLKCCSSFTIILIMISLGFFHGTNSETYTVGDEEEWDTGINYLTWSERYNFSMGDVLVFKYVAVQHNAYEVTEATYKSCDASTGVLAKYESGDDQVPLTEEKQYWFICTIAGHCLGGMRFTIDVKAASTNTTKVDHLQKWSQVLHQPTLIKILPPDHKAWEVIVLLHLGLL